MDLPKLSTDRLWLRPLTVQDCEDLHVAFGDPDCMAWWHREPARSLDDTRAAVELMLEHDAGHWAFGLRGSGEVLGHVGYVTMAEDGGHAGFGYALRRAMWGRGFAPEAARAALDHGFTVTKLGSVELWIHRDNKQSIRVAEKLGCLRRGEVATRYPRGPTPIVVYGITVEGWRHDAEPLPTHYSVEPILPVSDVAAAAEWWRAMIGFRIGYVYGSPPSHAGVLTEPCWTGVGGVQLALRSPAESGGGMVFVTVNGIDELAGRAEAAGAAILTPLGDRPWGMREIELGDPDGNRVRLGSPSA